MPGVSKPPYEPRLRLELQAATSQPQIDERPSRQLYGYSVAIRDIGMLHSHHRPQNDGHPSQQPGIAAGIYASQALGSVGAPTSLRDAQLGGTTSSTITDPSASQGVPLSMQHDGGHPAPPSSGALPQPAHSAQVSVGHPYPPSSTPARKAVGTSRNDNARLRAGETQSYQYGSQIYASPTDYAPGNTPAVHLQQATPQSSHLSTPQTTSTVPSSLQAGGAQSRPGPAPSYPAPTAASTMPQINTNAQQYTLPTRSTTMNQAQHGYSRSDSSGVEQKYIPFNAAGEGQPRYPPTPTNKTYNSYSPHTPGGIVAQSPLVLEHIRPRANSNLDEAQGVASWNDAERQPTTSNYMAPWSVFAYDWCKWPILGHGNSSGGKMAMGSYLEDAHNFIHILDTKYSTPEGESQPALEFTRVAEATCNYPVTRILWEPPSSQKQSTDLLATSGDHLRLWSLPQSTAHNISNNITNKRPADGPQKLTPLALLSNSKTPEHTAPLTSLDWNAISPKLIITSSIDTTCTIWDIPTLTAKTQLIAHDKEVFDVRFLAGSVDIFGSCGADGSVRMFDLRSLEHSTIIYEPTEKSSDDGGKDSPNPSASPAKNPISAPPPLLRLAASPHDFHLLATFAADSNIIRVLDVRQPGQALLELRGHSASLNCIDWSHTRRGMLASGADDSLVCLWDLFTSGNGAILDGHAAEPTMTSNNGAPNNQGHSNHASSANQGGQEGSSGGGSGGGGGAAPQSKGPAASWHCDYEVSNLSWAPQSSLMGQGGEWLGITGGRGIWGVKL